MAEKVVIIGAGLAGSEAAWQLTQRGIDVDLYEMRPTRPTPAHKTDQFAELVCSNSFGSDNPHSASRILKDELTELGGFVLKTAREHQVPAGSSLAVDREIFSGAITEALIRSPHLHLHREELPKIPDTGWVIIATGPLTSEGLSQDLAKRVGQNSLYFYDAISPIVLAESLNMDKLFFANRYDKGESQDFLNLPLTKPQYEEFVQDLLSAEVVLPHDFEEEKYFEGCMPIEAIAARGPMTLAFGPMKPVGLTDPKTGRWPHAVVQLRTENRHRTAYNLVGFQTKMKFKEQERILRKLPGLEEAEFLRLGCMHRNTYLDSPRVLTPTLQLKTDPRIFIAGQLTGTEGYLESTATGLVAALNLARSIQGQDTLSFPEQTMLGSLLRSITQQDKKVFQPMNSNLGILPPLAEFTGKDKKRRNQLFSDRSQQELGKFISQSLGRPKLPGAGELPVEHPAL